MGKRSDFERVPRDYYPTPSAPIDILAPHLHGVTTFIEPAAGDYRLARHLENAHGLECVFACDIEPQDDEVCRRDALQMDFRKMGADAIITNPPFQRPIMHEMITHFSDQLPTWLLIDADWIHTKQSEPFVGRCSHIISIGRIKWYADSAMTGKDNYCWYRFHKQHQSGPVFIGRETISA